MSIHTTTAELPRPMTAPASLHPGVIDRHFLRDPYSRERVSDPILEAIEGAMAFAYEHCNATLGARDKILRNEMESPMRRAQQVSVVADQNHEKSAKRLQTAIERVKAQIDEIEKKIHAPKPASNIAEQMVQLRFVALSPVSHLKNEKTQSTRPLRTAKIQSSAHSWAGLRC